MSENVKKKIIATAAVLVFAAAIALIVIGQRNIGIWGLLTMFAGLLVLIVLLYLYNRRFR